MTGNCSDCAKEKTCTKDIGFIWGFCNADFEPKKGEKNDERDKE